MSRDSSVVIVTSYGLDTIIKFLDIIHGLVFCLKCRPVYIPKYNVSETEFYLRPQVKSTQLGPVDRASPYLRTLCHFQDGVYKPKQHNSSDGSKRAFKLWRSTRIRLCTSDVSRLSHHRRKTVLLMVPT
jgi:hypothetical protein